MRLFAFAFHVILHLNLFWILCSGVSAQEKSSQEPGQKPVAQKQSIPKKEELPPAPAKVDVQPVARDEEIRKRLQSVLDATGWFVDPQVRVQEGVVFLAGDAQTDPLKTWAGDLARNTQDVVAVANRMQVIQSSVWDLSPAWHGLTDMWRDLLRFLPFSIFGLLVFALSLGSAWLSVRAVQSLLAARIKAKLLRNVLAALAGAFVFLAGTYVVLRVSGLTQLALTVVGGTGLVGLAVGIAFRDITENFLASIFLSLQRPFETGDLIEMAGVTGYVQQLNIRTTIVITLNGNIVQIPNALVYKSTLSNFTANPNRRESFDISIGYGDSIDEAQELARQVLDDHPAVLKDPPPWILVDNLGASTVNLRIYFWLNSHENSTLKVRSSIIRLVKSAFQEHCLLKPTDGRERFFPKGMTVMLKRESPNATREKNVKKEPESPCARDSKDRVSNRAEAGLATEKHALKEQARQAKPLDGRENLLAGSQENGHKSGKNGEK